MKILFMGNNYVGLKILSWLKEMDEEIVGLIIHPKSKAKYRDSIIKKSNIKSEHIFLGNQLTNQDVLNSIKQIKADVCLSVYFGYIIKQPLLSFFPSGIINIHPAQLPYNRGSYPNVWSIVDNTPAGVTMHYIDSGVDTGDIISQQTVSVELIDTGETLYKKLELASINLFKKTWPKIKNDQIVVSKQVGFGSHHYKKDVGQIDEIDLDQKYYAKDLINILRARTFPPYKGAYFNKNGRRIYLRLDLEYDE
jgi:methionyl-tRNA formyltransferase